MHLADLGWNEEFARAFAARAPAADVQPGRIGVEFNYLYRVHVDGGEVEAMLAGRLKHRTSSRGALPAVGDWVAVRQRAGQRGAIVDVLPRRSRFSRRMAGTTTDEQVVAANVDILFVVMSLDEDFSPQRLERYLLMTRDSGAVPVVLLTKPDLARDLPALVKEAEDVAGGAPAHVVSPLSGEGLAAVRGQLAPGVTGALVGSSGVGKTTIINRLAGGTPRRTREVRAADSKGRHTTTHRELIPLAGGGLIIDTPGMRELQLWDAGDAMRQTFEDIDALAADCRFADCHHRNEPQCAVKAAVAAGALPASRLESYLKLQGELSRLAVEQNERAQIDEHKARRSRGDQMEARRSRRIRG
jgi:ribosome biogenesis GTPase